MARKPKIGLDYAPQEVDIHTDRKIRRLLTEFGATGYLVYDYVKCLCYKENGYWIKYDDGFCFDVADVLKSGITEKSVLEILKGCFRMSLFNSEVFKAFRVITSAGIQKRFLEVRKAHNIIPEYYCIRDESAEKQDVGTENGSFGTENDDLVHKEKEKKEKQRKEEQTKIFSALVADWNVYAESNGKARILEITDKRKSKLTKRLTEPNFDLQKILIQAHNSKFIADGGWFTFDWVIESESNYIKVLEGNFNTVNNGNKLNGKGTNSGTKSAFRDGLSALAGEF